MAEVDRLTRLVVLDAGPLIHLDELGVLDLLEDFQERLVPSAVWLEVEKHRPGLLDRRASAFKRVEPRTRADVALNSISHLFSLHAGETEALQIAVEHDADLLLTDDTAARLAAKQLAVAVHGTLGILLRSIRRRQRTAQQVKMLLKAIPLQSTLHIRPTLLDEIIERVRDIPDPGDTEATR